MLTTPSKQKGENHNPVQKSTRRPALMRALGAMSKNQDGHSMLRKTLPWSNLNCLQIQVHLQQGRGHAQTLG